MCTFVCCNVVGVSDAHIGGGIRGDVGDDIVVDLAIVGIQPQVDRDVGIQLLEAGDGTIVDLHLGHLGIVLGPEGNFVIPGGVEGFRNFENLLLLRAVAGGEGNQEDKNQEQTAKFPEIATPVCTPARNDSVIFHPFIPPLETPAMIFFRKIRNRTISGAEMTQTAAIMAGIFSRPKPFSRIS